MNNLYIINEVLYDYTPGMAVIVAPSKRRCRELFLEAFEFESARLFDLAIIDGDYKVIENVNHDEGVVSYVYGGGS